MIDFLLVIPTYNEEKYIKEMIVHSDKLLSGIYRDYRIVVVDASSSDLTTSIVKETMHEMGRLSILESARPGSRGRDVLLGMRQYRSRIYCYVDADLLPSMKYLNNLLRCHENGYDVVLASRYKNSRLLKRPPLRKAVSIAYNRLINILFSESVTDHQCGFKLFGERAFALVSKKSEEKHWVWDTEVILLARYNKMQICEVPITWTERRSKRTGIIRLVKDVCIFVPGIARLFYRFRISRKF